MQTTTNVLNIILLIGIIQGFIFNVVMLKIKSRNYVLLFLSLIVFFLSLNNLQAWLVEKNYIKINYYIDYLHVSWNLFLAPMFYLFLTHYLRIKKKWLKNIFAITSIVFIISIILRFISLRDIKPQFNTEFFYSFLRKYNTYEDIFVFIYTIPIFTYSIYIFLSKKKNLNLF